MSPVQDKPRLPESFSSLRYVKGVGPKRAEAFEKLGVRSLHDLLYFFPRRYEDRSQFTAIDKVQAGETATVCGEILDMRLKPIPRMPILEATLGDETGAIHAVWFNQRYLKDILRVGRKVIFYGKVEFYKNRFQMTSPEYEIIEGDEQTVHTGIITPIYPLTEGLYQRSMRATFREALARTLDETIHDFYPGSFRASKNLADLREAVREMHFPENFESLARARRRIIFDEFLIFQMVLLERFEKATEKYRAHVLKEGTAVMAGFVKSLPFTLTASQAQAMHDLIADLASERPMNRLLQGDVGSGKTVVAAFTLLLAAKNKMQAALLVPTEILAEQHFRSIQKLLQPFGVTTALLTAATEPEKRGKMLAELKQNRLAVLVGTHAMLQEDVTFHSLSMAVIDEQHKFGVEQRTRLLEYAVRPHQLVMTATPIPRTLALTIYGDLKISTMKELPAGRQPIKTYWITRTKQDEVLEHVRQKLAQGEQAYFVFPLIEETEKIDLKAAEKEFKQLKAGVFKDYKMGLVHGRIAREEREWMMREFREGKIHILVATSVVEVGVDHPNATIMVIENAERFGLAQLHQLRGRIGRGAKASECFLFGEPTTEEGQRRLRIMTKTQDGFLIAEEDLKLRGPGDFMGTRQSGEPYFRVGHPLLDENVLLEAREAARWLKRDNRLETSEWAAFKSYLEKSVIAY